MSSQPDASQLSTLNSRILKQYWGYDRFRGIQEDIIDSISKNKDTLGLMPTGGGKSITFQVTALAKEGMCLVITPLIALMKDQVQNLKKRGIKALAIYSGMSRQDIIITLENCIFGNYKFLYISPERLDTELFLSNSYSLSGRQANDTCTPVAPYKCVTRQSLSVKIHGTELSNFGNKCTDRKSTRLNSSHRT